MALDKKIIESIKRNVEAQNRALLAASQVRIEALKRRLAKANTEERKDQIIAQIVEIATTTGKRIARNEALLKK